ncbi:MAG: hypothetical protein ACMXYA_01325, partial [Candidatus Woesearchaeota archaeon]
MNKTKHPVRPFSIGEKKVVSLFFIFLVLTMPFTYAGSISSAVIVGQDDVIDIVRPEDDLVITAQVESTESTQNVTRNTVLYRNNGNHSSFEACNVIGENLFECTKTISHTFTRARETYLLAYNNSGDYSVQGFEFYVNHQGPSIDH